MSPLSSWREDLTFVVDGLRIAAIFAYFVYLAFNGRRSLATARSLLLRVVKPDADMSDDSRAALDGGRLRAFRVFNSCTLAVVVYAQMTVLAWRTVGPEEHPVVYRNKAFALPCLFASIVFEIFPRTMTVRRYEILFIVATSFVACQKLVGARYSPTLEVAYIVFRVAASMVVCNPRLVLGMNALTTAGNLISHMVFNPHPMYGTIVLARRSEGIIFTAATVLSYSLHFCALRSALLQSELQTALKAQAPLRSLLARWCDATVELGSDLRMCQHSANLAALLFRPSCRLQGTLFEDLLHRADRLRFAQVVASCSAMEGPTTRASPAQVVQVSLLDRNGNAVPVQLVHTCIRNDNADCCHFIGIREEDAEIHAEPPPPLADVALTHQAWEQAIRTVGASDVEARVIGAASEDSSQPLGTRTSGPRSLPSIASSSGGSSGSNRTWHNIADVHVAVDVSTSKLEIVDASEAFIELGGPETIGSSFSSWLKDWQRLKSWLETVTNGLVNEVERLPEYWASLRFKTPIATCRAAGVAVDAEDFYSHAAADTDDSQESIRVRLVLSGVQAASHGAYRVGSNRRGSRTRTSL